MSGPYYSDDLVTLYAGDCLDVMRDLPAESVDAVVTDPPYDLTSGKKGGTGAAPVNLDSPYGRARIGTGNGSGGFMGKAWDSTGIAFRPDVWRECLRVLKPGGHMLSFGGPRTWHRLACAIEDAGFEIRDSISWIFGSGFPKSLNVTNALGQSVPADARCACGPRSMRTAQDSPGDYRSSHGSDGEPPQNASGNGLATAPSLTDALERSLYDPRPDAQASTPASNGPGVTTDHPSSEDSRRRAEPRSEVSPTPGSKPSGMAASMSPALSRDSRKTAPDTLDTRRSGDGSGASSLLSRYPNLPHCEDCGGVVIPQGLGTAMKPAHEPIVVARKPLRGTVAANVQAFGTGALNIDACRVGTGADKGIWPITARRHADVAYTLQPTETDTTVGRWPPNVVLTHAADCAERCGVSCQAAELDRQSGMNVGNNGQRMFRAGMKFDGIYSRFETGDRPGLPKDKGGASRFFPTFRYSAKAPTHERPRTAGEPSAGDGTPIGRRRCSRCGKQAVNVRPSSQCQCADPVWVRATSSAAVAHPTVKPLDLMRWLVRLVTPPGGIVLDPFAGSGTTAEACVVQGFRCIVIEREPTYLPLIVARLSKPIQPDMFGGVG